MSKRDVWTALFIYFVSGEIIWTLLSMSFPWAVWLIGQPILVAVSMILVGLTAGGKRK